MRQHLREPSPTRVDKSRTKDETALHGELRLQLSDELVGQLARALAERLFTPSTVEADTAPTDLRAPEWWWQPITQQEAAAFLRTSPSTVSILRQQGRLPTTDALGSRSPRYFRAQLIAWQLGLPIPLPPWSATTPVEWLWFPLSTRDAAAFLGCTIETLEQWIIEQKLPCTMFPGVRYFYRAQLLAWLLGKSIPQHPRWLD